MDRYINVRVSAKQWWNKATVDAYGRAISGTSSNKINRFATTLE